MHIKGILGRAPLRCGTAPSTFRPREVRWDTSRCVELCCDTKRAHSSLGQRNPIVIVMLKMIDPADNTVRKTITTYVNW